MIKSPTLTVPTHKIVETVYTDEEVFTAIKSEAIDYRGISNWFFNKAKQYAIGTWQRKYPRLQEADWELIFSEVNFKIIKRVKKGLELQEVAFLTYYTEVVKYGILDYFKEVEKNTNASLEEVVIKKVVLPPDTIENEERAVQLMTFLEKVTGNKAIVQVLQFFSEGYSYQEIVAKTDYKSEGACRNAVLKAKKKIHDYIDEHPEQGVWLRQLLENKPLD